MPVSKKRKTVATPEDQDGNSTTLAPLATTTSVTKDIPPTTIKNTRGKETNEGELAGPEVENPGTADREQERQERFKALQARAVSLVRRDVFTTVLFRACHNKC